MKAICKDLADEHAMLDSIVADIDDAAWDTQTPAEGWTVRDEISHLAYFDDKATIAVTDPDGFSEHQKTLMKGLADAVRADIKTGREMTPSELLEWWRKERATLLKALEPLDPKFRVPWYGPSMSARSHATARLMETWAHGQDIVDALGAHRPPSDRLRHVAHIGFTTLGWSYVSHGMEVPKDPVRLELKGPSGDLWTWGPEDAANVVRGPAEDFCLVVIQRRNIADTDLVTEGEVAAQWMSIAQCFAGPGTHGPKPGTFPKKGN
jgi:uncharacterized protein (TIGR03084 family)